MSICDFEIVTTSAGAVSIRNKVVNEIMHNPVGPWQEANDLYVRQSRLKDRLAAVSPKNPNQPLVLFDVGLGAASNALAAIHCALGVYQTRAPGNSIAPQARPLHIVSFENNLSLLEFALQNASAFPHMTGFETAMRSLLQDLNWKSPCGMINWELRPGDFRQVIQQDAGTVAPNLIFFDPYSPSVNREMWTLDCFQDLFRITAGTTEPVSLFTYSVATPVRTAFLLAGFYVGFGQPTGLKLETTEASTCLESLASPLDARWWERWQRSHKQMPYDAENFVHQDLVNRMTAHPQFRPN